MRCAALHTHEHTIGGLVEVDEDHAALREGFVRDLLEPLVQITISEAPREDADSRRAASASKAAEEPFGEALLPEIGEIDGGHAVIDKETAEPGKRARQRGHVGRVLRLDQRSGRRSRRGTGVRACRGGGGDDGESGDADG